MDSEAFSKTRPYAYHLTARAHLESLRTTRQLDSTERICKQVGREDLLQAKRTKTETVIINDARILIRDQQPLQEKRMDLGGRPFAELLAELNERVFFWAGTAEGPGGYGEAHFDRYVAESPIVLRIPMADLLGVGAAELCRYNSGSPRHSPKDGRGVPSPRGPNTFVPISEWRCRPSEVAEVTFVGGVSLPPSTEWGNGPMGPWLRLN